MSAGQWITLVAVGFAGLWFVWWWRHRGEQDVFMPPVGAATPPTEEGQNGDETADASAVGG